jgi:peroxiredoxin
VKSFKDEFDRRGVSIVVVSFAQPAKLVQYQDYHDWPFALLADPSRIAYQAFALKRLSWFRTFSPATLRLYFQLLRAGQERRDYGKEDVYQAGGDFIIDRKGNVLFAQPSRDPADRPPAATLLQAIDRVQRLSESELGG